MSTVILSAALVGLGLAAIVVGLLGRVRERERELSKILDLPFGERDVPVSAVTEREDLFRSNIGRAAGNLFGQLDTKGKLRTALERARIPLRPGEYIALAVAGGFALAVLLYAVTEQVLFGIGAVLLVGAVASALPKHRVGKRKKAFEKQLPDALSLIASSISAGHTFLRAIQMMCEESEPPMSEEFARVVSETVLGDSLVDALERMAQRLDIKDLAWVVQAIRIQQTVGGKLGDLLHTLADFIRAREEVRREVDVLTAEGRISAWVLGALPVFLLLAVQVISPGYMKPLFRGAGLFFLGGTVVSAGLGVGIILRMVKIEV
jgi:tight adherence protein B